MLVENVDEDKGCASSASPLNCPVCRQLTRTSLQMARHLFPRDQPSPVMLMFGFNDVWEEEVGGSAKSPFQCKVRSHCDNF